MKEVLENKVKRNLVDPGQSGPWNADPSASARPAFLPLMQSCEKQGQGFGVQ